MGKITWMTRVIDTKAMHPDVPKGYRNNNPLNVRFSTKNDWEGQLGRDKSGMCVFCEMKYGIRAGIRLIAHYQLTYNKRAVKDIITRWTPKNANNTEAYIERVCEHMQCEPEFAPRFGQDDKLGDCCRMIQAMIMVENDGFRKDLCSWNTIRDAYTMAFPHLRLIPGLGDPDIAEALPENKDQEEVESVRINYHDAFMEDRNSHFGTL